MAAIEKTIRGYHLHEHLGVGGFGAVYRASQPSLKREVAIKVILPHLANEPEFIRRFEVEAELVARLEHPHIVPLFDYWREPDGAYLVMRYLRGGSLRDALNEGALPQERIIEIMDQITQALHVAHRNGVVHRDIKPANILLDQDNNAYLTDFGIAKTDSTDSKTEEGDSISGSLHYMSPEQIQSGEITPQTDIYALGVMLYELFAGEHPFQVMSITDLLLLHIQEPLPDISLVNTNLKSEVNDVIQKATAKSASDRYTDVRDIAKDLRKALSSQSVTEPISGIALDVPNPYKGLRAFQSADANQFFGRTALIRQLLARLEEDVTDARFLAVVGPSGSGKSSVVKAGLMPALREGKLTGSSNVFITEMMPGNHPFVELETALIRVASHASDSLLSLLQEEDGLLRTIKRILPDDDSELILIIDQFEELFTLFDDDARRQLFLSNLVSAVLDERSRMRIIVTLRADFYDKPLHYQPFADLFRNRVETVVPMNAGELAECIVEPARQVGIELQGGLVETIIKEVNNQPGMLPLLQYALTELFERRSGNRMTLEAYTEMGGVSGALAGRAEVLYQRMNNDGQKAVRQMFLRLVTPGEGTADTRRRVRYSDLPENVQNSGVLKRYGDYRLLTFDRDPETRQPTVEVAHEAILHEWLRLSDWLNDSRDDIRTERLLASQVSEWQSNSQSNDYLLRGTRLAQFVEWREQSDLALTDIQNTFLDASLAEQKRQEQLKQAQQEQQRKLEKRAQRFFQILAFVLFVMVLGAIGVTIFALDRENQATEARDIAQIERDKARELALVNNGRAAVADGDYSSALAFALAANDTENPSPQAQAILADAAYNNPVVWKIQGTEVGGIWRIVLHPDGEHFLTVPGMGGNKTLREVSTGDIVQEFDADNPEPVALYGAAISPDGTIAAYGQEDAVIVLYDIATGEEIQRLEDEAFTDVALDIAFSPDGQYLAVGYSTPNFGANNCTGSLVLWNMESYAIERTFELESLCIPNIEYSADGQYVITASSLDSKILETSGTINFWDVNSGELVRSLGADGSGHQAIVNDIAITQDGKIAVSAGWDQSLIFWDVETEQVLQRVENAVDNGSTATLALSPDNTVLSVTTGGNDQITLYDMTTFEKIGDSPEEHWNANRIVFVGDNVTLLVADLSGEVLLKDLRFGAENNRVKIEFGEDFVQAPNIFNAFSPDLSRVIFTTLQAAIFNIDDAPPVPVIHEIYNLETGELIVRHEWEDVIDAYYTRWINEEQAATFVKGGELIVWDVMSGEEIKRLTVPEADKGLWMTQIVGDLVVLPTYYDVSEPGSPIVILNLQSGEAKIFNEPEHIPALVMLSPDGKTLLSGGKDARLIQWDVESGEIVRELTNFNDWVNVADISADSKQALTIGTGDPYLSLWDMETGEVLQRFNGSSFNNPTAWFTPDGILFSGTDGIRLFDPETGDLIRRYTANNQSGVFIHQVDENKILLRDSENSIRKVMDEYITWKIDSQEELRDWAENKRYVRDLTCEERELYQIEPLCHVEE